MALSDTGWHWVVALGGGSGWWQWMTLGDTGWWQWVVALGDTE